MQNPDPGNWVQLDNIWAGTKVSAPWGYQPHFVQYVDPWSDPASPTVKKIIAVPAARYEGNENGRGGYGSFKPENVWGSHISLNTDANHPMLMVCHSDGDNYGMKNSSAWHESHDAFLEMCKANADFDNTTVQDYLSMYPPSASDVIHVEPGSWSGADNGDPEFKKWNGDPQTDGKCPDRFSWSVLIAAQNRVILADSLENSYSINDVEWGLGIDTAKAWHYYLNGETSCYWYWDSDWGNPWNGNVTRACNLAIAEANKVLARHPGVDAKGPSIFPPQRDPYNPGGYEWNESTPQPSDFQVWTFADDASGLDRVTLRWRTDKDGLNPISSIQNELYANGGEVNAWNDIAMSGSWDPADKGPDNIVPNPANRAMTYKATISGQNNALIDYFVEAVDSQGNTNRSDIMHVWVGAANTNVPQPSVEFDPAAPNGCTPVTVKYKKTGSLGGSQVYIHIGRNGWQDVVTPDPAMTDSGDYWTYVYATPTNTTAINVCFNNGGGIWDNNGDANWNIAVTNCGAVVPPIDPVTISPANPVGCDPITITYNPVGRVLASANPVYIHVGRNGWQNVINPDPAMTASGANWTYVYTPAPGTTNIDLAFNAVSGGTTNWDNNNSADWHFAVSGCAAIPPGLFITNPPANVAVGNAVATYDLAGTAVGLAGQLLWSNALTGAAGSIPVAASWALPGLALGVGANEFTVRGSNLVAGGTTTNAFDATTSAAYAGNVWTNGSNGGSGFGPWVFTHAQGTGYAGGFIGNPTNAGIAGMGTNAFGFYANPTNSGANAEAARSLASPMAVGDVFQFVWGLNWDSNYEGSNRGFNLLAGETELVNLNMANSAAITINGAPMFTNYGAQAMTLNFQYVTAGSLRVWATGRNGVDTYDQTLAVSNGAPSGIKFYFNATDAGVDARQMYFNNLKITSGGMGADFYADSIVVTRAGGGPAIPPITFEAGAGFWFDLPGSYSLIRVEGATDLVGQNWNWATLAAGLDYSVTGNRITILTGGAEKRLIRIWLGSAPP